MTWLCNMRCVELLLDYTQNHLDMRHSNKNILHFKICGHYISNTSIAYSNGNEILHWGQNICSNFSTIENLIMANDLNLHIFENDSQKLTFVTSA